MLPDIGCATLTVVCGDGPFVSVPMFTLRGHGAVLAGVSSVMESWITYRQCNQTGGRS